MHVSLFAVAALGILTVEAAVAPSRNPVYDHAVRDTDGPGRLPRRRIPASHVVHERHEPRHTDGWTRSERADPVAILPMRIGLKQRNVDLGHKLLMNM
jgi:tripeptidyl-peptidase-1